MADSSEPAFLFLYRKEAVAPVDYLSTFATAPFFHNLKVYNSDFLFGNEPFGHIFKLLLL